jgi:hypothetical protein
MGAPGEECALGSSAATTSCAPRVCDIHLEGQTYFSHLQYLQMRKMGTVPIY